MISLSLPSILSPQWIEQQIADLGYGTCWTLAKITPEFLTRLTFDIASQYLTTAQAQTQLRKNLSRILATTPEHVPHRLLNASLQSYGRYWREAFCLPTMNIDQLMPHLDTCVEGKDYLEQSLQQGKGVILALPHSGNWDMAGVWLVKTHGQFTTVAERLKPESLYQRFLTYRQHLGFEVLPHSDPHIHPFDILTQRLQDNRIICLMADRDLSKTGITVDFFGEPTKLPSGPARLALQTQAPLHSVHCWFTLQSWGMRVDPPIDTTSHDITSITQELAYRFATNIAQHPQDWHMLQPQWLTDLPTYHQGK